MESTDTQSAEAKTATASPPENLTGSQAASTSSDPENPFELASKPIRRCWKLGYHDGFSGVGVASGEASLEVFAHDARAAEIEEQQDVLASLRAKLATSKESFEQLHKSRLAADALRIPSMGRTRANAESWFTTILYFSLAFLAAAAEFPLSQSTIVGSFGKTDFPEFLQVVNEYSSTAIVGMLCLIGFSMKIFMDVWTHAPKRNLLIASFASVTVLICLFNIYELSELRDAIAQREMVAAELKPSMDSSQKNEISDRLRSANVVVAQEAGSTFQITTIALPFFSALCLTVAFSQRRQMHAHNVSAKYLDQTEASYLELLQERTKLTEELSFGNEKLASITNHHSDNEAFVRKSKAAYHHGVALGRMTLAKSEAAKGIVRYRKHLVALGQQELTGAN